jgi:hypothetical protein
MTFKLHGLQHISNLITVRKPAMTEYQKKPPYVPPELKGRIIKNQNMTKPTSPQWVGEIMVRGERIRMNIWENEGEFGKYFSILVSDPDWKAKQKDSQYPREVQSNGDSDVPF